MSVTFIDGIGPPLEQIWEDYGCDEAEPGSEGGDVRAMIIEIRRLRARLDEEAT